MPGYPVFDAGLKQNLFCKNRLRVTLYRPRLSMAYGVPDFAKPGLAPGWGHLNAAHIATAIRRGSGTT